MRLFQKIFKKGEKIEIKWIDSLVWAEPAWKLINKMNWEWVKRQTTNLSVGYFVEQNKEYIAITKSRRETNVDYVGTIMIIPQKSVLEIKRIK